MGGRIDAHQHFWRYDAADFGWIQPGSILGRDYAPDDLRGDLDDAGIARTIAVQARQSEDETRWLLDLAACNPWIAGVVGWTDLRAADVATRLEAWSGATLLIGFRHVVQDEPDPRFLLDPSFQRGVRAALEYGFAYDLLIRAPQLEHVPAFLDAVGAREGTGASIVIDHGAKPAIVDGEWEPWAGRIAAVAREYPVHCKLSGLATEADPAAWRKEEVMRYMAHLLDCFGPERLIYGSDWPVCLLAAPYARVHAMVESLIAPLGMSERAAIMGGNAVRAYARIQAQLQGEDVQ
ncbi:MAG: amidohydrolase family protein [Novosphingobium sp.]